MKNILKFLLLTLTGLALASGANAKTLKNGVLTVATEGTYSPYSFHDEKGELTGYDIDVAKAVAKKLNLKIAFVEAPWDAMFAAFDAGKADVVFNQVSITDERKKKYDYSVPYTVPYAVIVTHKDNDDIKSFADLKGKRSAHSATSNWAQVAEQNGAQIVVVDGFSKGVELIATGRADATINDNVTFLDYIKQRPNAPIKIAFTGSDPTPTAALVKKGNEELVAAINKALNELRAEGKLKEISIKYFGKDISE
nr:amino acid ABC transporter substrate-binding protein [uncultured Campylobacter sp.]